MVKLHQFSAPTEGIHYQNSLVTAFLDKVDLGKGTIYVTESSLSWICSSSGEGFTIQYPKMSLHAISRDETMHPRHCLYVMVNGHLEDVEIEQPETGAGTDDDDADSLDSCEVVTEVLFVPDNSEILDILYGSVKDCTLLHPDSESNMSAEDDDEDDGGFIFDDGAGGDHAGAHEDDPPANGSGYGGGVPGQFDDAEEDEEEDS